MTTTLFNSHAKPVDALPVDYYYCGNCQEIRTAFFAGAQHVDISGKFKGGDIVCEECNFIIATAYKEIT